MISRRNTIKGLALLSGGMLLNQQKAAGSTEKADLQFSYCLNTSTISGQKTGFLNEFEITAKAGYSGIEIWVRDLQRYIDEGGDIADLKKRTNDLGITVENAIGFAEWMVDDELRRKAGLEQLKREMELLVKIGCKRIAAPPAGAYSGPGPDLFDIADRYRHVLETGETIGVTPQLEFWGASANLFHISQAMFVLTACDHPNACMLPDVFHMFRGGSSYESLNMISGNAIQMFHFNDFVDSIPRKNQKDSDRVYPGDGAAPFNQIIRSLYRAGGKKILSLELFNENYWKQNALEVAKTGLHKMQNLVEKALDPNAG